MTQWWNVILNRHCSWLVPAMNIHVPYVLESMHHNAPIAPGLIQYRTVPVYQLYRTPCAHCTGQDCTHFSLQKSRFPKQFRYETLIFAVNLGTVQGYNAKSTVQGQCVQLVQYKCYTTRMCTGKVVTRLVQYLVEIMRRCFKWLLQIQV